MNYKKILLEPHCDDAVLFACHTLIKENPLVISWANKECTQERRQENIDAMKMLGIDLVFIHELWELSDYLDAEIIYAPSFKCLHEDHIMMAEAAKELFGDKVIYYSTYIGPRQLQPKGTIKIKSTREMEELKLKVLQCYKSQIIKTPKHFLLKDKSEYYD